MTAYINVAPAITEIRADHVWTDGRGVTNGVLNLGPSWITFDDPRQVREIAAALNGLADAMDAKISEARTRREVDR